MPKYLLFGGGGMVFGESPDELVNIPLNTPTGGTTPTPTLLCAGGTEPSILLQVMGESGSITWCGQTWNLPGDSGEWKEVCPTAYTLDGAPVPVSHRWQWSDPRVNISLRRNQYNYAGYSLQRARVNINDDVNNLPDDSRRKRTDQTGYQQSKNGLGVFGTAVVVPTTSDYLITDNFFGSYDSGSVTYTWARGTNW